MDVRTLFVTIALAYGILAILLLVSERPRRGTPSAMLALGYGLGAVGVLLQAGRGTGTLGLAVLLGNLLAWLGLLWQAWAALAMSGRTVASRTRLTVAALVVALGVPVALLPPAPRAALSLLVYAACFALAAWALVTWRNAPRALRMTTAVILGVLATLYGGRSLAVGTGWVSPNTLSDGSQVGATAFYTVAFAGILSSAFGLILLGKRAAERSLAEAHRQTETILSTLNTGVAILAHDRIERVNPALAALLDCLPADLEGQPVSVLFPSARDGEEWQRQVRESLAHDGRYSGEVELAPASGGTRWTWAQCSALDEHPGSRRIVMSVTDITVWKDRQEELESRATTDDLTGLPNRRAFLERASVELSRANRTSQPVCVAVIDLDHLKAINDLHGHAAGDQALLALARACTSTLRDSDLVARMSGDEFAAVLPDSTLAQADAVMGRLLSALRASAVTIGGFTIPVGASIGIAEYTGHEPVDALLARADEAMYLAKEGGRGAVARQGPL